MKQRKITNMFLIILLILSTITQSLAHSGRTDSKGGHYDRKTGTYHYHNSGTTNTTTNAANTLTDEIISELKSIELDLQSKSNQLESLIIELEELLEELPEQVEYLNQLISELETIYEVKVPLTYKKIYVPSYASFYTEKSILSEPINISRTSKLIWEVDLELWEIRLNSIESMISTEKSDIVKSYNELITTIEKLEVQKDMLMKNKLNSDLLALTASTTLDDNVEHERNDIKVYINGNKLTMSELPFNEKGRVLVPLRTIFESLGLKVGWKSETKTVTGEKDNQTISLTIGNSTAYVNNKPITLDVPAMISNNTTFVPVRFISESIGANVNWDEANKTVNITMQNITSENNTLKVHYLDVGQADSILVQTPNGKNIIIDAGNKADADTIIHYLRDKDIERVDALILTHPHEDHIGSAVSIISNFEVSNIYMPKVVHTTVIFEDLINAIRKKDLKITPVIAGNNINIDSDVIVEFLAPNSDIYEDLNNYSAVIKITYKNNTFLFMGDAEDISESEILKKGYDIKADVIKIGHHGSKSSTTEPFVKAVSPKHAIISVGKENNFGHPSHAVIDRLTSLGTNIYRTDFLGTIIVESDGKNVIFR